MKRTDSICRTLHGSFDVVVIENAFLRMTIVPELGGKIGLPDSAWRVGTSVSCSRLGQSAHTARALTATVSKFTRRVASTSMRPPLPNACTPKNRSWPTGYQNTEIFGAC